MKAWLLRNSLTSLETAMYPEENKTRDKLLQEITSAMVEGVIVADSSGRVSFMNAEAELLLGWRISELAGQNVHETLHFLNEDGTANPQETCPICFAMMQGKMMREGGVFVRKNGAVFPVSYVLTQLMGGDRPAGTVMAFRDITKRREAEDMLDRLVHILDESSNEIYMFDAETLHFMLVNTGAQRNLGYSMDELRKLTPLDLKSSFTPEMFEHIVAPLRRGKTNNVFFEAEHRRKDSSLYPVEVRLHLSTGEASPVFVAIIQDISERKRVRRELKHWADVFQHAQWGVAVVSANGEMFEFMNPAFAHMHGYTVEELTGQQISRLFPADYCQLPAEKDASTIIESMHARKDGRFFPALLNITTVDDADGKVIYRIINVQDITTRKKMEKALLESERHTRHLLENLESAVVTHASDGSVTYMNAAAQRFFGFNTGKMSGMNVADFFPLFLREDGSAMPADELPEKRVLADGTGLYNYVVGIQLPDLHTRRWALVNAVPDIDENASIREVIVSFVDITKRKEMEEALSRSEARFSAMTNNVPGMVFQYIVRGSGSFTFVSEGSVEICGLLPKTLLDDAASFLNIFSGIDREFFFETMDLSARNLSVWNWEGKFLTHPDQETWLNLRATPRLLDDGCILWDGVILNVTEGKKMAQEVEKSRELLRELSAHRDVLMEEEQKWIARELHDELGQALTALRIDLDWIEDRLAGQEIRTKVLGMSRILANTVDSMRRVVGHLRPDMLDDLGLAAAIEWQVEQLRDRTGIRCELDMNRNEFKLNERIATCVFRVIQEALTNVARHAEAAEVQVAIEEKPDEIRLEVRDNGRGFQSELKIRSFGLLGIRERVHILGGKVKIESVQGLGTTVSARIPLGVRA